ncbi:PKD domain-containing protein [bacterium]|nr:PKD domain-containing protein [bacterium]
MRLKRKKINRILQPMIILLLVITSGEANVVVADFVVQPSTAPCGIIFQFDGGLSSATPDHTIIAYEWNFDYDGITFDVQATGVVVEHSYSRMNVIGSGEGITIIPYTVALRVRDDSNPAETDIATGNATLSFTNSLPIADAGGPYYSTIQY